MIVVWNNYLKWRIVEVIFWLSFWTDGMHSSKSVVGMKEIKAICHRRQATVQCEDHIDYLHCNNVQSLNEWTIKFTSQITNASVIYSNINNAVLTYSNLTINKKITKQGICRFRKNVRRLKLEQKKRLACHFVSLPSASQENHALLRHNSCQCICAFDIIPEIGELTVESLVKQDESLNTRYDGSSKSKGKEMYSVPEVFLEPTVIEAGNPNKNIEVRIVTNDSDISYYLRLLHNTSEFADCCNNEHAEVIERTLIKNFTWTDTKKKLLKTSFDNYPPGTYCIRLSPTHSATDQWCINTSLYDELIAPPTPLPPPESNVNQFNTIVLGIVAGFVIVLLLVGIWVRFFCRRPMPPLSDSEDEEDKLYPRQEEKTIFVLYSHDCDKFADVIEYFSTFLEKNMSCKVSTAKRETDDIATNKNAWITQKLDSDIIIVAQSEGAFQRQEAFLCNKPLRPRDEIADYEKCVFEQVLEALVQKELHFNYKKVFKITFPFTNAENKLKIIVENRRYDVPDDLNELCRAFGLPKDWQLNKHDAAYRSLLTSIKECKIFLKKNPNFVAESLVEVQSTAICRPDTLSLAECCSLETDISSANCTNLSETYPLTVSCV